ncbi:EscR/YscR/HrcR family type III secretion system export apparatus protein [Xylophilus rhododendri]|uniref:EscR/YscR/HrcR family type III secretion system export apparatus protein n=1 Tax=Xylophilus rhododendri TaxID=2697032 RepID=A0A857JAD5_9BURK|nr:type III secretion system export apparatus subunit SctR [Xylophilus rhododendri]QHI99999.1 EscR/YscR/HrcR family type III secretion system export apparatus protein [Xylophilus rhododendri]
MNFQPGDIVGLALVTVALGLLPLFVMSLTSFVKISVVLTLVRNALGVQQVPPTMVINGLALILTVYILMPTLRATFDGFRNKPADSIAQRAADLLDAAHGPFKDFLAKHAHEREKRYFLKSAADLWPKADAEKLRPDDLMVVAPAFVVSELTEGFRIGFLLYLAFIVVDLVVANVLVAIGLSQASPTNIAIPLKLLLFVVLDGWSVLLHGLVQTYR